MNKLFLQYGDEELEYLRKKDKKLAQVIEKVGFIKRERYSDLFDALVNSIIGQQISRKAHVTVYNKVISLLGDVTPENVLSFSDEKIQKCGLTFKKVEYIKSIAGLILDGEFDINELTTMSDDDVCKKLTTLSGVGVWTAEMLMLFAMNRKNILSYNDLIIQRGLRMIYHHRKIDKKLFEKYKRRYSPYCSIASLYIWAVGNDSVGGYKDYAPKKKGLKYD